MYLNSFSILWSYLLYIFKHFSYVGTLQTGYAYAQASSQDKWQSMRPHAATCPIVLDQGHFTYLGFSVAECPTAPNLAPQHGRDPMLPHILWLRTSPSLSGGLRCWVAPDPAPPHRGGSGAETRPKPLRGQWAMRIKNKPTYARLVCYQGMRACYPST
jgi:hypothetical protein